MFSDQLAVSVYNLVVRDLQALLGDVRFAENALDAFSRSIQDFRSYEFPQIGDVDPLRFKAWWQASNLLKRYRFESDAYTDDELLDLTLRKFFDFQSARSTYTPFRTSTKLVLQEARKICKAILCKPFDPEPYRRFGTRATVNCPRSKASLDVKLEDPARFSCSSHYVEECKTFFASTPLTKRMYRRLRKNSEMGGIPLALNCDTLNLVCVPKSWKVLRPITPLSEFGLYMSFGLGGYVENCLREEGLDIRRLQTKHRLLAKRFSQSRSHVTADLSSASDSLRSDILNAVLPRWFYLHLRKTFCRSLNVQGRSYHTSSVLPMGNGATFPVETLVFYCLSKAVGSLLKVKGTFSVYGDDLIYPRRIHHVLCGVFHDLGIMINSDKTFCESYFRESCGGDYYHGVDVRPALFPSDVVDVKSVSKWKICQYLYKVYNSLQTRWLPEELPRTFSFLESEIERFSEGRVFYVPLSFPATSGIQTEDASKRRHTKLCGFQTTHNSVTQMYAFDCLLNKQVKKPVPNPHSIVFLWNWFRQKALLEYNVIVSPQWRNTNRSQFRNSSYSMSRVVAHWFLKSVNLPGRETLVGRVFETPSLADLGPAHVKRVQLSNWA